jgi:AraC-like DNA-binding protein/DNA-binding MarR family transcriptional regulator
VDVLADVLRTARAEPRAEEWLRPAGALLARPGGDGVTAYAVADGACRLIWDDGLAIDLTAGHAIFLTRGRSHALGGGPATLLAGRVSFAGGADHPLAAGLPDVLSAAVDAWGPALRATAEDGRPGWQTVAAGLVGALFVEALRSAGTRECATAGWLRGLGDPQIGEALRLIHAEPDAPWTVADLADRLAVSRSAFAARFKTVVGTGPVGYLTWWRLHRAAARLRRRDGAGMAEVAREAGYATEAAFGKAFKRLFGRTPGQVRREAGGDRSRSVLQAELRKRDPFEVPEQEVGLNLARTAFQVQTEFARVFARQGLTSPGYNLLRILRGVGGPLPPAEALERMVARPADAAAVLAGLVTAGLAEETEGGVAVTDRGRQVLAALDGPVLDLHRRQLGHLTPGELAELNRLLVRARRREGG